MIKVFVLLFSALLLHAEEIKLSCSLQSAGDRMITSRYMGFVKEVLVREGDEVKKNQVLYKIDSKEIDAQKTQVELQIAQAELQANMYSNQYQNVALNLERHKRLFEKDMISKYELETLEVAEKNLKDLVDISEKQVIQARKQLEVLKNQYNYLTVKSPIDGVIVSKNVKEGEMAMPGMPAFMVSAVKNLEVVCEIGESDLAFVKKEKKVKIEIPAINHTQESAIASIIPYSNPMTHKFRVKIPIDSTQTEIYPGMFVKVMLNE